MWNLVNKYLCKYNYHTFYDSMSTNKNCQKIK